MILSSADILRVLRSSETLRLLAEIRVADAKPGLRADEGSYVYVERFPAISEFQATWRIYVEADDELKLILQEIRRLLPSVQVAPGLMTTITTTDFLSEDTQRAPEAPKQARVQVDLAQYEERFQTLVEDVQDQMLLVTSGRPGKDGRNGRDGVDGRDGKDLQASEVELEDLADVESSITKENGQVLTWKDGVWQNLFIPQIVSSLSSGAGATELGELTDVNIDPALLESDFGLVYDGTEWVVASPPVLVDGHNQTGVTIPKGTPVYVAGTHSSGKPLLGLADANGSGNAPAIGLTHEDIVDGIDGHVMLSGILTNVDSSAYSAGDALYLSTTPGVLTNVRPTAANEKVQKVGLVTRVHATAGSILIIGAGRTNDINNELVALIGAGDRNAVDLGAFPGSTISDNTDVKAALQELEAAVESSVDEAPQDGNYYVRQDGAWVLLTDALTALNVTWS